MRGNKLLLSKFLSIFLTVVVLWFVFSWFLKDAELAQIVQTVQNLSLISLALIILSIIFNLWVFQYPYLVTTPGLTFWQAFLVRNTSFAISNSLPAGGTIGLGLQYSMLKSFGISSQVVGSTLGISSVWNGLIAFFMPVLGLIALLMAGETLTGLWQTTIICVAILIFTIFAFIIALRSDTGASKVGSFLNSLINPVRKIFNKTSIDARVSIISFRKQVIDVVLQKWKQITFTNFMVQIGMFLILLACAVALNVSINPLSLFAVFCFGRIGTSIPLTPGGLGTTDVIMATFMQTLGVPAVLSVSVVLLWRGFFFVPQVLAGAISFFTWQLSRVR